MNRPAELTSKTLTNAPKQDLRTWLSQMEAAGERVWATAFHGDCRSCAMTFHQ